MSGVLAWDNRTNAPAYVPFEEYQQGLASGRYRPSDNSTVTTTGSMGVPETADPTQGAAKVAAGEAQVSAVPQGNEDVVQRQRAAFDTTGDKLLTFGEGVADALSLGLIREHGEQADVRRDVNSTEAFLGNMVGLAGALVGDESAFGALARFSPAGRVARSGEELGSMAARAIMGEAGTAERGLVAAGRRGLTEGVQQSIMAGAAATGHEATDALIDNKDFAAEHIVNEAGFGLLLGGGFGAASELFGRAAARIKGRDAMALQGGLMDPASPASAEVHGAIKDAVSALDEAADSHRVALGVMKAAEADMPEVEGAVFLGPRRDAMRAVDSARAKLDKIDLDGALAKGEAGDVHRAAGAVDAYHEAVQQLDQAMRPGFGERQRLLDLKPSNQDPAALRDYQDRLMRGEGFDPSPARWKTPAEMDSQRAAAMPSPVEVPEAAAVPEAPAPRPVSDSMIEGMEPAPGRPPLQAFAHDVEHAAAGIPGNDLASIHVEMAERGGAPPKSLDRFKELAQQAHDAGHIRLSPEGDLIKSPEFRRPEGAPPPAWSKNDRFRGGNGAPAAPPAGPSYDPMAQFLGAKTERLGAEAAVVPPADRAATQLDTYTPAIAKADHAEHLAAQRGRTEVDAPRAREPGGTEDTAIAGPPAGMGRAGIKPGGAIDDFLKKMEQRGPMVSPGAKAAARVQKALESVQAASGGRLSYPRVLEAAHAAGLPKAARGPLGEQMANLWGLRQLGEATSAIAKGVRTPLAEKVVRSAGRAAAREAVYGGNMGSSALKAGAAAMGGHFAGVLLGAAGGIGMSVGAARDRIVKSVAALLNGSAAAVPRAAAMAAHYSYDGSPPTDDVHQRVTQIQQLLQNPDLIRERARETLGPLAVVHPQLVDSAAAVLQNRLQNLSVRAPMFVWSALGEVRAAGAQGLRKFREYEDATWTPQIVLDALARGCVTKCQADAMREQHPESTAVVLAQALENKSALERMPRDRLAALQLVSGLKLSNSDPAYAARAQSSFQPPPPSQPQKGPGALKSPPGTPAQSPIAPGNGR